MIHYNSGLFLTQPRLGIDVRRRQPRSFVSHAHADHIARHELAYCTPETARLYQHRLGRRPVCEMHYRKPIDYANVRLTAYPAGHCLGSAMLLVEDDEQSMLYTGDYKLGPSATAEPAEVPKADILVMESTFGKPRYVMPPRDETIEMLVALLRQTMEDGFTPVLHLYMLGKSQEMTKILTSYGIGVQQQPDIYDVSCIYEACGVPLGNFSRYEGTPLPGHVLITSPMSYKKYRVPGLKQTKTFAITGWAIDSSTKYRMQVDYAIPISDHADYNELMKTVELVEPKEIYCTHGPYEFVEHLLAAGYNAKPLEKPAQRRLF